MFARAYMYKKSNSPEHQNTQIHTRRTPTLSISTRQFDRRNSFVICMIDHRIIIKRHKMNNLHFNMLLFQFQSKSFQVEISMLQSSVTDT